MHLLMAQNQPDGSYFFQSARMKLLISILAIMITSSISGAGAQEGQDTIPLVVKKCPDFNLTGTGDNNEWNRTEWNYLAKLDTGGKNYSSKFKILYSAKGIYVLFY